jgi:hypothetical protein
LCGSAHWSIHLLLLLRHLIGELECALGRQILHLLGLDRVVSAGGQMLGWRDHAHIDVLLVGSLDLLLLLLKQLDLLLDRQLFHCRQTWVSIVLMLIWVSDDDRRAGCNKRNDNLLPGEENMLIKGVSSEGLLRWAMCSLRPVGPGTPP